jgi:hypothetical protein
VGFGISRRGSPSSHRELLGTHRTPGGTHSHPGWIALPLPATGRIDVYDLYRASHGTQKRGYPVPLNPGSERVSVRSAEVQPDQSTSTSVGIAISKDGSISRAEASDCS